MGMIMLIAGAAGMIFCIVLLCVLPHIFEKQRKKLLGRISREREKEKAYEKVPTVWKRLPGWE